MDDAIERIKYKGYIINVFHDDDAADPRKECDNLGRMICFHNRYNLGDEHVESYENDPHEFKEWIERNTARGEIISLPLYLYDHSGITMNTTGFSCPWDSGMVGWIYVTKSELRKEYGKKRISKKVAASVLDVLRSDVKVYDDFISGRVYGYEITKEGAEEDEIYNRDIIDSCWGFIGDYDEYMVPECKAFIDRMVERDMNPLNQK